ncbi:MAG: MBL fold metallo-hydrolase [Clostridia bacterium]|nr:MBL fold metallo-hydrolase [Clostridia bacterium]
MDDSREMALEEIFGNYVSWKLDEVTWIISFMNGSEYIYLLEGEEKALLLDTGYGIGHLRNLVERLTRKPVIVANTHYHPDHSAGNAEWEEVLLSPGWPVDAPSLEGGRYPRDPSAWVYPDYRKTVVHDGDVIELGGRSIRVLEALPAHCNSSLFFVDEGHKMLFSGDEFESSQTLVYDNSCNPDAPYHVEKRIANLRSNAVRLREIAGEGWFVLPNHNGTPISRAYLDGYVALCDAIYAGTAQIEDKLNHRYIEMDPKAPELCRVRFGTCSIFIKKAEVLKVYGTKK